MKKSLLLGSLLIVSVFILTGLSCGKKTAEKAAEEAAEKAIEDASGGQADVDYDTNTVTINTNGGSYQAGQNVSLPSGFPRDVYVVDGQITSAATVSENEGYTISIENTKSVAELKTLYEEKLKDEGWNLTLTMAYQDGATIGGEKDGRSVTVGINASDQGKTIVVISTATNQ